MIEREITPYLKKAASEYPVVTVTGPMQSGKTTLVKMVFPEKVYYSLEAPDIRSIAFSDPRGFLAEGGSRGMIIDEVQHLPQLLSYIQVMVDERKVPGSFILTGSHQPRLHEAIAHQSLAGRVNIIRLLPFSISEVKKYHVQIDPFDLIFRGFYPAIYEEKLSVGEFYRNYIETYVERDVRSIANIHDLFRFQQFMILLAGRTGQILNYSSISNDLGISVNSVKNWISVLLSSYLVFILPPYYINIRKRVVKSPKIYFTDVGLGSFLLGIKSPDQVKYHPLRGNLYENMVIVEIIKSFYNKGNRPDIYFFRDSRGNEIDLVIRISRGLILIEIKSASTFTPEFLKSFEKFKRVTAEPVIKEILFYNGEQNFKIKGVKVLNPLSVKNLWNEVIEE